MPSADETELYCIEGVNIDVLLPTFYVPSEEEGDIDSKRLFGKSFFRQSPEQKSNHSHLDKCLMRLW